MTYHPLTKGTQSPSENYPANARSDHSQDVDFAEDSSSSTLPYRIHRCQNCNDNGHKEDFYRESSTNRSTR
ncbi:unnamed protein product [Hymenolepis diminuta]|uniref:CCHC-type domain-containing protein n=1 Tax=Hymenolepis diminuta TaxID=6216 RepID=A0A0R3SY81_HYMDI|nr:unnamed protein product [Hymenolepis diminuta]